MRVSIIVRGGRCWIEGQAQRVQGTEAQRKSKELDASMPLDHTTRSGRSLKQIARRKERREHATTRLGRKAAVG